MEGRHPLPAGAWRGVVRAVATKVARQHPKGCGRPRVLIEAEDKAQRVSCMWFVLGSAAASESRGWQDVLTLRSARVLCRDGRDWWGARDVARGATDLLVVLMLPHTDWRDVLLA
jgi:hypothetical protein